MRHVREAGLVVTILEKHSLVYCIGRGISITNDNVGHKRITTTASGAVKIRHDVQI